VCSEPIEFTRQTLAGDREANHLQDALAAEVVYHVQHPETPTIRLLVTDKIH